MNEDEIKKIWKQVGEKMNSQNYGTATIEQFINSRSHSIEDKISRLLQFDIVIKSIIGLSLIVNIFLYFNTYQVLAICVIVLLVLIGLIYFEMRTLNHFRSVVDPSLSARDNLSTMLSFLKSRFDTATMAIASTGLFLMTSGMLIYFWMTYGRVRPLDAMDYFVFGVFYLIGIVMGFVTTSSQVKYHIRHLTTCLSDLNEGVMTVVSENIETQRKQDRIIKTLLLFLLAFGFVLLILIIQQVAV
jgi:hypothetical protein